ncbi:hypothetical protein GmRootV213_07960 [Variovorax sp. V213]
MPCVGITHTGFERRREDGKLRFPQALVAGEAGQQDKVRHGPILRDRASRRSGTGFSARGFLPRTGMLSLPPPLQVAAMQQMLLPRS